jgi:hypothetical protein
MMLRTGGGSSGITFTTVEPDPSEIFTPPGD